MHMNYEDELIMFTLEKLGTFVFGSRKTLSLALFLDFTAVVA